MIFPIQNPTVPIGLPGQTLSVGLLEWLRRCLHDATGAGMPKRFQGEFLPRRDRDGSWVRAMEGRPVISERRCLVRKRTFAGDQSDEMRASMEKKQ